MASTALKNITTYGEGWCDDETLMGGGGADVDVDDDDDDNNPNSPFYVKEY